MHDTDICCLLLGPHIWAALLIMTNAHCLQALHKTAHSSWTGPAAGAALVGAGLCYYFSTSPTAVASAT